MRLMMLKATGAIALCLTAMGANAEEFDLDVLIEAAKGEPQLTVFDSTGKIVTMAENFSAKYGVDAVGQKVKAHAQLEMMAREAMAGLASCDREAVCGGNLRRILGEAV